MAFELPFYAEHLIMFLICQLAWHNISDEPTDVSSMAKRKDEFEDILDNRRHQSDLKYSIKQRMNVPTYKYCHQRTPSKLKQHVLNSDRVKYRVELVGTMLTIQGKGSRGSRNPLPPKILRGPIF